jgi:hypothetical protein
MPGHAEMPRPAILSRASGGTRPAASARKKRNDARSPAATGWAAVAWPGSLTRAAGNHADGQHGVQGPRPCPMQRFLIMTQPAAASPASVRPAASDPSRSSSNMTCVRCAICAPFPGLAKATQQRSGPNPANVRPRGASELESSIGPRPVRASSPPLRRASAQLARPAKQRVPPHERWPPPRSTGTY